MSAPQDPFNFSGMAATLAPSGNSGNPPPPYQQQQPPQQQYMQPAPQQQQGRQMVVAAQPHNPYAGIVQPHPPPQQPPPTQQHASPWDTPAAPHSNFLSPPPPPTPLMASASSFDPFAAPPAPAPAPVVAPAAAPPQQQQQQPYPAPPIQDPWAAPVPTQQHQYPTPASNTNETQIVPAQPHEQQPYQGQPASYPNDNYGSNDQSYGNVDDNNNRQIVPVSDDYQKKDSRNPYSAVLAQQVSGGKASALPKANLVGKKGFVLSRISFRTIVMKKWKQSFWVQYGGHTMLWFRSQSDFDDWLNNPYHTQMQRNFLIKLAINFVHDLYKPNVRGYQVTQCRTKPYGKAKVVRQFKLERWMDYGPTIAAAFGSFDPKEVDACREAIVECMKNTPLDNGIRATGAVKEHHDRQQQEEWRKEQEKRQMELGQNGGPPPNGASGGYNNYSINPNFSNDRSQSMKGPRSMSMPNVDLLGDNFGADVDDSASVPPGTYAPTPANGFFGDGGALVPAVNPNAAYPGAPPAPASGNPGQQPAFYPTSAQPTPMHQQQQFQAPPSTAGPHTYGAPTGAPVSQGYPQQQQPSPPQYSVQAPAPSFAQQPPQQPPADYGGYPQQHPPQMQQQAGVGNPVPSYPVPAQQF